MNIVFNSVLSGKEKIAVVYVRGRAWEMSAWVAERKDADRTHDAFRDENQHEGISTSTISQAFGESLCVSSLASICGRRGDWYSSANKFFDRVWVILGAIPISQERLQCDANRPRNFLSPREEPRGPTLQRWFSRRLTPALGCDTRRRRGGSGWTIPRYYCGCTSAETRVPPSISGPIAKIDALRHEVWHARARRPKRFYDDRSDLNDRNR